MPTVASLPLSEILAVMLTVYVSVALSRPSVVVDHLGTHLQVAAFESYL
ncbi:MAG: hypothetical protein MUE55_05445 [Thermoplasmata archaeon]|nr:hypothetical protein [Thermoplasmata archaeon]